MLMQDYLADLGGVETADWSAAYRVSRPRGTDPVRAQKIHEARAFFEWCKGRRDGNIRLQEAFSTSDYPLAFSWFTDRKMLADYLMIPAAYEQILLRSVVPDFRPAARDRLQGLNAPLATVKEGDDYKNDQVLAPGTRNVDLQVSKTGRTFPITFEAQVNDVLRQLERVPRKLAEAARRTEMITVTRAYALAGSSIYSATHSIGGVNYSNLGSAPLSISALKTAITAMRSLVDDNGNPIFLGQSKLTLVVPPQLEIEAKQILGAPNFIFNDNPSRGTAETRQVSGNYLAPMLNQVTDYYLPLVDTVHGTTAWYLFADPNDFPAGEVAFLQGHETPELFMKQPNAVRITDTGVTGGLANPMDGSFENDSIAYKVRHEVGAAVYEWRGTYKSTGA